MFSFVLGHIVDVLWSWFGLVAGFLTILQVAEWTLGFSTPVLSPKLKALILLVCLFAAQSMIVKDLDDQLAKVENTKTRKVCEMLRHRIRLGETSIEDFDTYTDMYSAEMIFADWAIATSKELYLVNKDWKKRFEEGEPESPPYTKQDAIEAVSRLRGIYDGENCEP